MKIMCFIAKAQMSRRQQSLFPAGEVRQGKGSQGHRLRQESRPTRPRDTRVQVSSSLIILFSLVVVGILP